MAWFRSQGFEGDFYVSLRSKIGARRIARRSSVAASGKAARHDFAESTWAGRSARAKRQLPEVPHGVWRVAENWPDNSGTAIGRTAQVGLGRVNRPQIP